MKHLTIVRTVVSVALFFTLQLALSSCTGNEEKKCCEGYTGKLTNDLAKDLVNKCHFLPKDSIETWTKKYDAYKKELGDGKDSLAVAMDKMAAVFLRGGSISFNNCIVKKILCNENSIGLRVLYGIDGNGRMHIILVGIQPDYSNLYVSGQDECCKQANAKSAAAKSADEAPDEAAGSTGLGGAEYGQMP